MSERLVLSFCITQLKSTFYLVLKFEDKQILKILISPYQPNTGGNAQNRPPITDKNIDIYAVLKVTYCSFVGITIFQYL